MANSEQELSVLARRAKRYILAESERCDPERKARVGRGDLS
jgi:hypothetical protein